MSKDVFADLNEALTTQMEKVMNVNPRDAMQLDRVIAQSEAVADLAGRIIDNNNSKIRALQLFDSIGMDAGSIEAQRAKMLGDGR